MTIAVSDAQRSWYVHCLGADPERVMTVRNGVADPNPLDSAERRRLRAEFGTRDNEVVVTTVSIMRSGKGHEDVLALAETIGADAGVRFVLVGDGNRRKELEALAHSRSTVSAPVVFAGFRDDVPALLAASDVVVHPAYADALPTALIHALAVGRPIVGYAVGGVPEIVTPRAGILVRRGDRDALGAAMRILIASTEERLLLGMGARARFEEHFTTDQWVARLRHVYTVALTESRGGGLAYRGRPSG